MSGGININQILQKYDASTGGVNIPKASGSKFGASFNPHKLSGPQVRSGATSGWAWNQRQQVENFKAWKAAQPPAQQCQEEKLSLGEIGALVGAGVGLIGALTAGSKPPQITERMASTLATKTPGSGTAGGNYTVDTNKLLAPQLGKANTFQALQNIQTVAQSRVDNFNGGYEQDVAARKQNALGGEDLNAADKATLTDAGFDVNALDGLKDLGGSFSKLSHEGNISSFDFDANIAAVQADIDIVTQVSAEISGPKGLPMLEQNIGQAEAAIGGWEQKRGAAELAGGDTGTIDKEIDRLKGEIATAEAAKVILEKLKADCETGKADLEKTKRELQDAKEVMAALPPKTSEVNETGKAEENQTAKDLSKKHDSALKNMITDLSNKQKAIQQAREKGDTAKIETLSKELGDIIVKFSQLVSDAELAVTMGGTAPPNLDNAKTLLAQALQDPSVTTPKEPEGSPAPSEGSPAPSNRSATQEMMTNSTKGDGTRDREFNAALRNINQENIVETADPKFMKEFTDDATGGQFKEHANRLRLELIEVAVREGVTGPNFDAVRDMDIKKDYGVFISGADKKDFADKFETLRGTIQKAIYDRSGVTSEGTQPAS